MENHDKEPLASNYPQHPVLKWLSYRGTPPPPTDMKRILEAFVSLPLQIGKKTLYLVLLSDMIGWPIGDGL